MDDVRSAYEALNIGRPRRFQETAWQFIAKGANTIISAGTGSGKTEAALLPALATGRRIIALYPTKALLQDQLPRVRHLAGDNARIAVDTGDEDDKAFYRADVILTSLDKFMYRFFGYGKKRWSYLYPYRIAFDDTRGTTVILDEAHAYEQIAFSHFWFLLKKLAYERSVQTVLLSATLPSGFIEALEDKNRENFPRALNEGPFFERVADEESRCGTLAYAGQLQAASVVGKAIEAFDEGKRVIVVLDAVVRPGDPERAKGRTLHEVWERLVQEIGSRAPDRSPQAVVARTEGGEVKGNVLAYHGRQMPGYRRLVLRRLKTLDQGWQADANRRSRPAEPFILLTTSALEVGVDLSSDLMITDLCDCDSFVQRIGRCARRPGESGAVSLIARDDSRVHRHGQLLWDEFKERAVGSAIDDQLKQQLNTHNTVPDLKRIHLRLEYLQDQSLYRYVYDFVQENRELWEKGVLVTREWEPSIALVRGEHINGQPFIGGVPARDFWCAKEIKEKLLIPISGAAFLAPRCTWVVEGYNEANQYTQRVAVGGSNQRTLVEALRAAGIGARSKTQDDNKVGPVYALGLPLIFVKWSSDDPNIGLSYVRRFAEPAKEPRVFAPSPLLRARKVLLTKGKCELPLYWFEPREEDQTDETEML